MSKDPILARRTPAGKLYEVRAVGGLNYIRGNQAPYFSVTQEAPGQAKESCGAALEEIAAAWPHLKPLCDLHLSDINGVPMHAEANGWYWMVGAAPALAKPRDYHGGNGKRQHWKPDGSFDGYRESVPDECLATFAKHARITLEEAAQLRDRLIAETQTVNQYDRVYLGKGIEKARALFGQWVQDQKPRWKAEADACINALGLVVYGDHWTQGEPA